MPVFKIELEISLGFSHSGEVCASGEGEVELTDTEVQQLVNLIRENDGETDVEELGLKETYPEIYEKLDDVCGDIAYHAEYNHWVIEGFENDWSEVDNDEAIFRCEEKYGFEYIFDREKFLEDHPEYEADDVESEDDIDEDDLLDAKTDAFFEWVDEYRGTLDEEAEVSFLSDVFEIEPEVDGVYHEVVIPEAIVEMAMGEKKD